MRNDAFGASELGARLRKLRVRAQLTQDEVADRMGLTYSMRKMTVMLLETGRTANPTVQTLGRFLRACGALWGEVMPAVQSLLPADPSRRLMAPYLEGVRTMYRAWKQAVRGAVNRDPVLDVQMAFDRIEQAGLERLVPAVVHKMREIVFDRLMRMVAR